MSTEATTTINPDSSDISPDDIVFSADHLQKTYTLGLRRRKVYAVKNSTFAVHKNEIVGLVGPNGAGKTTTMKMLTGLVKPDAGRVTMFGLDTFDPESRRRLGYLPENPYFYEHLSGRELLRFYGNLFGLTGSTLDDRIEHLIQRVGLAHAADRAIKNYSKGMRQRAGIAQALINDPDLVILDEPQSGLDPIGRREIRDLILEQKHLGKTVLFSSHILPDVEAVCDRIIIMKEGSTVELHDSDWSNLLSQKGIAIILTPPINDSDAIVQYQNDIQKLSDDSPIDTTFEQGNLVIRISDQALIQPILRYALDHNLTVVSVNRQEVNFENLLMTVLNTPSNNSDR